MSDFVLTRRIDFIHRRGSKVAPIYTIHPFPMEQEPMPLPPYPDEQTFWLGVEQHATADYLEAGRGGLDGQAFRWFTRTMYDICAGLTPSASWAKHRNEMRQELGLPPFL